MDAGQLALAAGSAALVAAACTGLGALVLAATRVLGRMTRLEAAAWSFGLGFGVLGWAVFFLAAAGALDRVLLAVLSAGAVAGMVLLRRAPPMAEAPDRRPLDSAGWLLALALAAVMAVDAMEALAPPADADSLAYHFALPKQFLAAGRLEFVPRALDGAIPLLVQMTYLVALALGGELALTMWTALSGWMAALLTYAVARRHLHVNGALLCALLALSAPAVLYGGGTGQVEIRLALFATIAAFAVARAVAERNPGFAVAAGLAAGFFAAGKYTGLLFGAAAALPLLIGAQRWRTLAAFAGAALLAGFQWYAWNWHHIGDPVFPALFALLGLPDGPYWTAAQHAVFQAVYAVAENPLPIDPLRALLYPFIATLAPPVAIEAGRTGFGPYGLLVLPFALGGAWRFRHRLRASPLFAVALIAAAFYLLWFASGISQRVRHLLPIWPLFVVCVTVAAVRWADSRALKRPLAAAVAFTVSIHLAAQAAFGVGYARHSFTAETRSEFLARNVPLAGIVDPVEKAMGPGDRVAVDQRQLVYLFDRPVFYYHHLDQAQINAVPSVADPARLMTELGGLGITHLLMANPSPESTDPGHLARAAAVLERHGCAERTLTLSGASFGSRTLPGTTHTTVPVALYRVKNAGCRPSSRSP